MAQLTENNILDAVYEMREGDNTHWATTDAEYLTGRGYCNLAINRWETYDNTLWRELWTTSVGATGAVLTITAGTYTYAMPTNMRYIASYVRTVRSGNSEFYTVIPSEKVAEMPQSGDKFVYITGSIKDGFTLHFNPNLTLTTGDTIAYEYYKQASTFTDTTSSSELDDPYFLVYYVLSLFYDNDGEDGKASKVFQIAEERLEQMRVRNMSGFQNIYDPLVESLAVRSGFGN